MTVSTIALGTVVDVSAGQPAPKPNDFSDEGHPFIRAGSLEALLSGQAEDACEKIDAATARKYRMRLYPKDTILFAKSGMSAKIGRIYRLRQPAYVVSHLAALAPTGRYEPAYLAHWLQAHPPSKLIKDDAYPSIRTSEVESLEVPNLDIDEQRRIAAILDKADVIRRKRDQVIGMADDFLQSVFQEMFGDPTRTPSNFKVRPLGQLVDQKRGISYGIVQRGAHEEDGVPIVRITDIAGNVLRDTQLVRASKELSNKYRRTILKGGEILLSIRGTVGRVAIAPSTAKGYNVSREVAVIPLLPGVDPSFVRALMLTEGAQRFMTDNVKGVAQSGINLRDVRLLPVPNVPPESLSRFRNILEAAARIKRNLQEPAPLLESLSQRAFCGEL